GARGTATPMIKLFLADDRPVVLEGLRRIVAGCADIVLAGHAANRGELLRTFRTAEADVLLLDVSVAGRGIFALLRQLRDAQPTVRVLVLGIEVDSEDGDAARVLGTGAAGYLTRDHSPRELLAAIRTVVRGAEHVSSALGQRLISSGQASRERPRYEALSEREYQVLCMFGAGRAFSEIAAELRISRKTVSTYRTRILRKLCLTTNAALIRYVVENRLAV
ncbi:MAG: LuxR C-terminal-related transcriptional regulator, partial [Dehalococcoidia bacterium]